MGQTVRYFETVIVGGGPAGTACGITLQQQGRKTCLLERTVFPRDKTCEGMLSAKTLQELETLLPGGVAAFRKAVPGWQCKRFTVFWQDRILADLSLSRGMYVTRRLAMDAYLLSQYRACGGTVVERDPVATVDFETRTVTTVSGLVYYYDHLVAADGAESRVRRLAGLSGKRRDSRKAFTFTTEFPLEIIDGAARPEGAVCAYLSRDNVIEWAVPHGETCSLATCFYGKRRGERFPRERFSAFAERLTGNKAPRAVHGAFFPSGNTLRRPCFGSSVLFVGDAAGFAEPLTGEGIYYALHSGRLAAQCLIQEPAGRAAAAYVRRLRPMQEMLRRTALFKTAFCRRFWRNLAIRLCLWRPELMRRAFRNISADGR